MEQYSEDQYLQAVFAPVLEKLEAERLKIVNYNYSIFAIAGGIVFAGALFAYQFFSKIPLIVGGFLGVAFYGFFSNKGAVEWTAQYKQEVIKTLVDSFFAEHGSYEPENGHSEAEFLSTELFDKEPDRYNREDLIRGKVDKTTIAFSEVHAEYESTDSKNRSTWHTIFKGILFTADFNKHFNGRTLVKQKGFWDFAKYSNIDLENPEFKAEFDVFSDDAIEARYILSPALMEKILKLNKDWGGYLGFSFVRSQLTIAIPMYVNSFDLTVGTKIDPQNTWKKDWQMIADLVNIVQELDLNTRIWTKE